MEMDTVLDLVETTRKTSPEETCELVMEQAFYDDERTMVMIDGRALHATVSSLSFDVQYGRLSSLFKTYSKVAQMIYYNDVPTGSGHYPQVPLMKWLNHHGYVVNQETLGDYNSVHMLVRMASDMQTLAANKNVNHFVVMANHSSLAYPISQLIRLGLRVTVIGAMQKPDDDKTVTISPHLIQSASQFIDLRDIMCEISR